MLNSPAVTLYGLVALGQPIQQASIRLLTNQIDPGYPIGVPYLIEPTVNGYVRQTSANIEGLFPSPVIVPGRSVRLVSKPIDLRNRSNSPVGLTGAALVVKLLDNSEIVAAVSIQPQRWLPQHRLYGRLLITSLIRDEG